MRTILKDLWTIISLRNTINTNLILYGIRRIPVIGELISDDIYGIKLFKIIAFILSIQHEILKALFGDITMFLLLYFGTMGISYAADCSREGIYLYGFIVASIINVFNFEIFKGTLEAEYAVFGLGMDAKKFTMAKLVYKVASMLVTYIILGIPVSILSGVPVIVSLFIPAAGIGFDFGALALKMWIFSIRQKDMERRNKKKDISIEGTSVIVFLIVFAIGMIGFAGVPIIVRMNLPFINYIFYAIVIFVALATFPCIKATEMFPYGYYRIALAGEKVKMAKEKAAKKKANSGTASIDKERTRINQEDNIDTGLKGYAYLNEIFFKRHRNIIYTKLLLMTLFALGGVAFGAFILYVEIFRYHSPEKSVVRYIFLKRPAVIIPIMWMLNYTDRLCHIMFANCDSVMLKFNFYRSPKALESMYKERVVSVIRCNIIPACLVAIFSLVAVMVTGGEETPFQCIFNILLVGIGLVAASVWHLSIYYLIQPYANNLQVKSKLYTIVNLFIIATQYFIVIFPIPAWALCLVYGLGTAMGMYIFVSLVKMVSPKTFRIR